MPEYDVLIDSDAFIGYILEKDAHHQQATALFNQLIERRSIIATTNYVIAETASTLSRRFSQVHAKQFMQTVENILTIYVSKNIHQQTSQLFSQQSKDKTSLVDMSNVIVMNEFKIPKIFAFDKVYSNDFNVDNLTKL